MAENKKDEHWRPVTLLVCIDLFGIVYPIGWSDNPANFLFTLAKGILILSVKVCAIHRHNPIVANGPLYIEK